jgi:hypothetical protein
MFAGAQRFCFTYETSFVSLNIIRDAISSFTRNDYVSL